jgi:hypothetical protein
MKKNPNNLGQPSNVSVSRAPQLALRTDLRAGAEADKGCEAGIGYWRKEFNYWKNKAQSLGCA